MSRTNVKSERGSCFSCMYGQVCRVNLQLQKFARDNVELLPGNMELLTDTELTQYYIQTWSLDYNDPGANILQLHTSISLQCFLL